jgi:hypothetical protein
VCKNSLYEYLPTYQVLSDNNLTAGVDGLLRLRMPSSLCLMLQCLIEHPQPVVLLWQIRAADPKGEDFSLYPFLI